MHIDLHTYRPISVYETTLVWKVLNDETQSVYKIIKAKTMHKSIKIPLSLQVILS